jgi:hypothetical protein
MIPLYSKIFLAIAFLLDSGADAARWEKGRLVYANPLQDSLDVAGWVMEGPGETIFNDGWMQMYSPAKQWDHVFWCPEEFPSRFIAEWEVRNVNPAEGLLIIFFATTGLNGEDIFDKRLPARDGTFKFYTKDQLKSYHVSYYTNNPKNPDRALTHLRKNNSFALVQTGTEGIPKTSTDIHRIRLVKDDDHILFFVEDRKVIDWTDDGKTFGPVIGAGKIGFRQMRWSHFAYRNFNVWEIE